MGEQKSPAELLIETNLLLNQMYNLLLEEKRIREDELPLTGSGMPIRANFPIRGLWIINTSATDPLSIYEGGDNSRPAIIAVPASSSKIVNLPRGAELLYASGTGIVKFCSHHYSAYTA